MPQPSLTEECATHPGSLIIFKEGSQSFCEKCLTVSDKQAKQEAKKNTDLSNDQVEDLIKRLQAPSANAPATPVMSPEDQVLDF